MTTYQLKTDGALVPTFTFAPIVSSPSVILQPYAIQNMHLADGVYQSDPGWEQSIVAIHFKAANVTYGQKFKASFSRYTTYPNNGNWKWFRVWRDRPGQYPNFYVGQPYTGWIMTYVELLDVSPHTRVSLNNFPFPIAGQWRDEIYEWQMSSGVGATDGKLKITIGGVVVLDKTDWQCDSVQMPGVPNYVCIQDDPSNFLPPAGVEVRYKNIWVELL